LKYEHYRPLCRKCHRKEDLNRYPRPPKLPCSVEACDKLAKVRGLCNNHYVMQRYVRKGRAPRFCSVEGCDAKHRALGFCTVHYKQDFYQRKKGG